MKKVVSLALVLMVLFSFLNAASAESGEPFSWRVLEDGSALITGYSGTETDIVIPETVDGHTVTGLAESFNVRTPSVVVIESITVPDTLTVIEPGALQSADRLAEIRVSENHPVLVFEDGVLYNRKDGILVLYLRSNKADHFNVPEGIREIADMAFYHSDLLSVSVPGSVERLGRQCFDQGRRLSGVNLSEGLKFIGKDAFANCDKLKKLVIPASVTEIEEAAFTDNRLEEIRVAPGNPVFTVSDGALVNIRDGVVITYPTRAEAESCVIPEGVKRIGGFAFYRCHRLKQVTFPEGLMEIGYGAFISCNHLTAVDLPDSVNKLESRAFEINSDVVSLHLPAGLTEIRDNFADMAVSELVIPDTVTAIERSFTTLPNLTEVVIPDSVETIGINSFVFCKKLAAITIPAGVTKITGNFAGNAKELVIRVEKGSCAEQYCLENGLNFEYIPE